MRSGRGAWCFCTVDVAEMRVIHHHGLSHKLGITP